MSHFKSLLAFVVVLVVVMIDDGTWPTFFVDAVNPCLLLNCAECSMTPGCGKLHDWPVFTKEQYFGFSFPYFNDIIGGFVRLCLFYLCTAQRIQQAGVSVVMFVWIILTLWVQLVVTMCAC
jgi:hypothetical protein